MILYALSVGVDHSELQYLYELDPKFTALPTYALVLQSKGDGFDVNSFAQEVAKGGKIPGLPDYNLNNMVHGEQGMELLRPVPLGGNFNIKSKIAGVYDKGSGMVIDTVKTLVDNDNIEYVKMTTRMFIIGYGGWDVSSSTRNSTRENGWYLGFLTCGCRDQKGRALQATNYLSVNPML